MGPSQVKKETRLCVALAATRACAFGIGAVATGSSGFVQMLGYVLVLLGLPDVLLIRSLRDQTTLWIVAGVALVFVGTLIWIRLVSWILRTVEVARTNRERG